MYIGPDLLLTVEYSPQFVMLLEGEELELVLSIFANGYQRGERMYPYLDRGWSWSGGRRD